jgi:nucleolin
MQLSDAVEEDDLWEIFEGCGTVSKVKLLYDRETNASRGLAFIDFEETEATDKAVKMTDQEVKGKAIFVKYNAPREEKGKGKDGKGKGKGKGGKGPGEKPDGCLSVMVMGLSDAVEEDDLWEIFEKCGTLTKAKLLMDRETWKSRGMAFIDFEETESTDKAVKMSDQEIKGKAIFVKYNVPREPKGGKGGW